MAEVHDPSKQNAVDMAKARSATSIDVPAIRDFLYSKPSEKLKKVLYLNRFVDGSARWRQRERIIDILSKDPLFDKANR
jgi:acyl-CoA oxidase